jgi:hypothetical protein
VSEGSLEASELALGVGGNPLRLGGSRIAANIAKLPDLLKRSVMIRLAFFGYGSVRTINSHAFQKGLANG